MAGIVTSIDVRDYEGITTQPLKLGTAVNKKPRVSRHLDGYVGATTYAVHDDCVANLARGVVERVLQTRTASGLADPLRPVGRPFEQLSSIRNALIRLSPPTTVVDREQYPSLYHGRKRAIYEEAVSSLLVEAVTKRDAVVKTFVKAEKVKFSADKPDPAPRVIQPRSPRYNVEVGRYLKLFEKSLFYGFRRLTGYTVIMKGMNASDSAVALREHWDAFSRPCAFGLDASRFDQHVSIEALRFEHSVYDGVFKSSELRELLRWQLVNKGRGKARDGRVSYTVKGCRMSGDVNTSMGNCLIMSCIVLGYIDKHGIKARLANNGDDCNITCERDDVSKFDGIGEWFKTFGFKLTREPTVFHFEKVEFCQTQPVLTSVGWRMVRNPYTASSKDCMSLLDWSSIKSFNRWRCAVGTCGLELTRGVPFWEAYYTKLWCDAMDERTLAVFKTQSGIGYACKGVEAGVVDEDVRYSFYLAFGMYPDEQKALEELTVDIKYEADTTLKFGQLSTFNGLLHL